MKMKETILKLAILAILAQPLIYVVKPCIKVVKTEPYGIGNCKPINFLVLWQPTNAKRKDFAQFNELEQPAEERLWKR